MKKFLITATAAALALGGALPASADVSTQTRRYETTLVGNVETSTVVGATVVQVHVTNSAAIKRDSAPKFTLQFKGLIVPVKLDTRTVVRRLGSTDRVSIATTGLNALTTIPMYAGDRISAKVRCAAVVPADCVALRLEVRTPTVPPAKRYELTLIGRITSVTDTRTATMRPTILQRDDERNTLVQGMLGTDVQLIGTNGTRMVIGTVRSTGTFAGLSAGYLAIVHAKCTAPTAPAVTWSCAVSTMEAAALV